MGSTPRLTVGRGPSTRITANYEHFKDYRTADRGIPSFEGGPVETDAAHLLRRPGAELVRRARSNIGHGRARAHRLRLVHVRNRILFADYDKMYQNVFPGAVDYAGTEVSISAYNNATDRENLFNQTELTYRAAVTGGVSHTLLGGVDLGRQMTDNFRNTGFFNDTATTRHRAGRQSHDRRPVTFRQSATDADNHVRATSVSRLRAGPDRAVPALAGDRRRPLRAV